MQHSLLKWTLALLGLLGLGAGAARADHPLAGKWKVTVLVGGSETALWILQIDENDGKFSGKVVSSPQEIFAPVQFDKIKVGDKALHLDMILHGYFLRLSAHAPKGAKEPETLYGSLLIPDGLADRPGGAMPIRLNRTDATKIDPEKAQQSGPGADDVKKLEGAKQEDQVKGFRDIIKKYPNEPVALVLSFMLLNHTILEGKAEDLKALAEAGMKVAAKYGPEMEMAAASEFAILLSKSDKTQKLAIELAREAEKHMPASMPAYYRELNLRKVSDALKWAGKADEAKKINEAITKLGPELDQEFKKTEVPFTPDVFKGRKGKSDRVAVVEMFTGAYNGLCVASDAAFNGMLKTYKPSDVILLEYHVKSPIADPLTCKEGEARAVEYYKQKFAPTFLVNGKEGPAVGGSKRSAKKGYDELCKVLKEELEQPAQVDLKLKVSRDGNSIKVTADVGKVTKLIKSPHLRFIVVEDDVHFPAPNGQRYHHHVVRGMLGGVNGVALPPKGGTFEQTLDLKKLKLGLLDFLTEQQKEQPVLGDQIPMELKHLKIVALIQSDDTKEILNAVQVDVPAK